MRRFRLRRRRYIRYVLWGADHRSRFGAVSIQVGSEFDRAVNR